jgi:hypothetical protein
MPVQQKELVLHGPGKVEVKSDHPFHHVHTVPVLCGSVVFMNLGQNGLLNRLKDVQEQVFLVFEMVKDSAAGSSCDSGQFRHGSFPESVSGKKPGGCGKYCISF